MKIDIEKADQCTAGLAAVDTSHPGPRNDRVAAFAVATAVISSFLYGYQTLVLNTCADLIAVQLQWCGNAWQSDCGTSDFYIGLVSASVYLGAAIGSIWAGQARMSKLGARTHMLISDALFAAGGLCAGGAQNFTLLLAGRLLSGVGLGLCSIATPLYIAEISPREKRGVYSCFHGVGITCGILAASSMGLPQSPPPSGPAEVLSGLDTWYWRFLLAFQVLPAALQALVFYCINPLDPPTFLVKQGEVGEARKLLYTIYGIGPEETPSIAEFSHLEMQINELVEASQSAEDINIAVTDAVFDPFLRCAVFLGFGLAAFQQLSGINALMAYSNMFFREGGIPASQVTVASTCMATANVVISYLVSKVVDDWGRRQLLLFGSYGQAIALGVLSISVLPAVASNFSPVALGIVTVVAFTLFVVTFSAGLGAITWLYLSEIYPQEIRSSALSACGVIKWVCCFGIVFVVRFLSLQQTCWLLFSVSALGSIGVQSWIIETKSCSIDDSPLTPRSGRSSSKLLTPRSPQCEYQELAGEDEE